MLTETENGFMEPKYLSEEVTIHPTHHLTFGDWIPRVYGFSRDLLHQHF